MVGFGALPPGVIWHDRRVEVGCVATWLVRLRLVLAGMFVK